MLIYASQLMTNYFTSFCPFKSGKWEVREKLTTTWISYQKSFLYEIKTFFEFLNGYHFWMAIIEKIEIWLKIALETQVLKHNYFA